MCIDFQKCLDAPSWSSKPHLCFNLPRECAYVHEMLNAGTLMPSPQQTPSPSSLQQPANHEPALFTHTPSPPPSRLAGPSLADMGSVNNPITVGDGDERYWPSGYHVVDIARCLCECSVWTSLKRNQVHTQKAVFEEFFPHARFIPATFTDQKKLWVSASDSLREKFIEAGRTKQGLWSMVAHHVCTEKKATSQEVVDIK